MTFLFYGLYIFSGVIKNLLQRFEKRTTKQVSFYFTVLLCYSSPYAMTLYFFFGVLFWPKP